MQEDDHVDPQDAALNNSRKASEEEAGAHMQGLAAADCYWNDKRYSDGATVCDNHQRFKCWNGRWVDIGNC